MSASWNADIAMMYTGLVRCPNCERLYDYFVNDRCPVCKCPVAIPHDTP